MSSQIKNFFKNFRQYPALGIALAIGVVAVLFYIYKSNQSNQVPSSSQQNNPAAIVYSFDITPPGPSETPPTPTPTPSSGTKPSGILCGPGTHWDATKNACVPNTLPGPPPPTSNPPPPPPKQPPPPPPPPPTNKAQYIIVTRWPSQNSTLSGIAKSAGVSLDQVERLNPQYKNNYNLIFAGQKVRVR